MPKMPRKKPGQTWPGLDPGESDVFDDEAHDGDLMDVERKKNRSKRAAANLKPKTKAKTGDQEDADG